MTKTSPVIVFGTYDALGYKQDVTLASSFTLQSFSKINDLKMHARGDLQAYATFEPDFWLLDGSLKIKPEDDTKVHVGIMGTAQTDVTRAFPSDPVLTCTFSSARNTDGLIFYFDDRTNDYASGIQIEYYNASNTLIRSDEYSPAATTFSTNQAVTAVKKIIITFTSTNKPYRYLRLLDIDFANGTYFAGDEIKDCKVIEEIDPVSVELPAGSLDFRLFTTNPQFSIIEPAGGYTLLQYKQPLYVYEGVDDVLGLIGKFFVDNWKNVTEREITIHAIDTIGVCDTIQFLGTRAGEQAGQLLSNKLLTPNSIPYTIDASLQTVNVTGVIPICSVRDALKLMTIAIGGYAYCARSGVINIVPIELASDIVTPDYTITSAEKGVKQSLELSPLVTGVEMTSHNYDYGGVSTLVFSGTLGIGDHYIIFDAPKYNGNMTITGATEVTSNINYVLVNVAAPGTVTVTIENLSNYSRQKGIYNTGLTDVLANVVKIEEATLVKDSVLDAITQRVYDYYQQRYLQHLTLFAPSAKVGDTVYIDTYNSRRLAGIIERMELDLSGGFVVKADIRGIVLP
jgi:hypothetical protein